MVLTTGPSQAANEAAAVLNPINFKKSLLFVELDSKVFLSPKNPSIGISSTNSFCFSLSTMESLGSNSAPLFQYFLLDAISIFMIYDFDLRFTISERFLTLDFPRFEQPL